MDRNLPKRYTHIYTHTCLSLVMIFVADGDWQRAKKVRRMHFCISGHVKLIKEKSLTMSSSDSSNDTCDSLVSCDMVDKARCIIVAAACSRKLRVAGLSLKRRSSNGRTAASLIILRPFFCKLERFLRALMATIFNGKSPFDTRGSSESSTPSSTKDDLLGSVNSKSAKVVAMLYLTPSGPTSMNVRGLVIT